MPARVTASGIVVRGATTALTRRTTCRKNFLGPWHPLVEACWLYSLADAQRHTDVAIHHSILNLTHHHTNATPSKDNFPAFTQRFHRDLSSSLNTLLAAERYDAPREVFDGRSAHCMRLVDAHAQASHLVYERVNPVAAGLVASPDHVPMRSLDFGLWRRGFIEVKRPPIYFSADRPETLQLRLTPPPLLYRAFGGDLDALIYHLTKLTEEAVRALRDASKREPLGARALRRMHPWSEPRSLRETGGRLVPSFRIGAGGLTGKIARIQAALDVRRFRRANREAFHARRAGDTEHQFPFGSYAARVYDGAPIAPEPHYDALVTRPGPLLDEVKAELAHTRGESRAHHGELVREVGAAFTDEAAEIAALEAVDSPTPTRQPMNRNADIEHTDADLESRAPVHERHRFEPRPEQRPNAARIVTLRDRRRGRPPKGRHGSDPPV
jgi:hypothetical protein